VSREIFAHGVRRREKSKNKKDAEIKRRDVDYVQMLGFWRKLARRSVLEETQPDFWFVDWSGEKKRTISVEGAETVVRCTRAISGFPHSNCGLPKIR
jgi:hypothetical protein